MGTQPITNQSYLDDLNATLEIRTNDFGKGPSGFTNILVENSDAVSKSGTMTHIGPPPSLREWIGERMANVWRAYKQTWEVKPYEKMIELDMRELHYDAKGAWAPKINQFFNSLEANFDRLITSMLVASSGAGPTGYDGKALFATDHPHGPGGGTQANRANVGPSYKAFDDVMQAYATLRWENGDVVGGTPTWMMCGPKHEKISLDFAGATDRIVMIKNDGSIYEQGDSMTSIIGSAPRANIHLGKRLNVIVNPYLTGTQDDYVYFGTGPLLMRKNGRPFTAHQITTHNQAPTFFTDKAYYGVHGDFGIAANLWQSGYALIT